MGRVRDMRLLQDWRKIKRMADAVPFLTIKRLKGQPPTEYILTFNLKGYVNGSGTIAHGHDVRLIFPEKYPLAAPPKFAFLKGLFHPNVYLNGDVCHGWYLNNWNPAINISDFIVDIAKMICFKTDSYNMSSPANYSCDKEWIAKHIIPIDNTSLGGLLKQADPPHASPPKIHHPSKLVGHQKIPIKINVKNKRALAYQGLKQTAKDKQENNNTNPAPTNRPIKISIKRRIGR